MKRSPFCRELVGQSWRLRSALFICSFYLFMPVGWCLDLFFLRGIASWMKITSPQFARQFVCPSLNITMTFFFSLKFVCFQSKVS